ncbi:MAG TPA: hypothetical protein DCL44_10655 [Elusimicrobia bacterium]|nr:hypothetical protein [Elusimicrobiota bacterium]
MACICLVDDDPLAIMLLKDWLEPLGYKVCAAGSAETFVDLMSTTIPDLIIMDMQFPGGGAPAAMKVMQGRKELASIPVILFTSMPTEQINQWFPESPLCRHHVKPIDFPRMEKLFEELLQDKYLRPTEISTPLPPHVPLSTAGPSALAKLFEAEGTRLRKKNETSDAKLAVAGRLAEQLLADAVTAGASDIHIESFRDMVIVRYRIDGTLKDQLSYAKDLPLLARLRIMAGLAPIATAAPLPEEGSFDVSPGIRARLALYPSACGDKIAIRILNKNQGILNLEALGFLPDDLKRIRSIISQPNGIFLVSGATGSGKTTTLCSLMLESNAAGTNIMTLEDPIEYQLPRVIHTQVNPKAGLTFAEGLRAMLRQDPNIIMVGEIRDKGTAEVAFQAAMTGHLILSSIHATDASGVVARLIGMGIDPYMISTFLIGALSQHLVRRVCPHCSRRSVPDPAVIAAIMKTVNQHVGRSIETILNTKGGRFLSPAGCEACSGTGYKGRVGIYELLSINSAISELIFRKASVNELSTAATKSGMKTFVIDAVTKAWGGWTTIQEAAQVARWVAAGPEESRRL